MQWKPLKNTSPVPQVPLHDDNQNCLASKSPNCSDVWVFSKAAGGNSNGFWLAKKKSCYLGQWGLINRFLNKPWGLPNLCISGKIKNIANNTPTSTLEHLLPNISGFSAQSHVLVSKIWCPYGSMHFLKNLSRQLSERTNMRWTPEAHGVCFSQRKNCSVFHHFHNRYMTWNFAQGTEIIHHQVQIRSQAWLRKTQNWTQKIRSHHTSKKTPGGWYQYWY